jgi:hypothetical protein
MNANGGKEWVALAMKMDDLTEHEYIRKHILEYKGVPEKDEKIDYEKEKEIIYRQMEPIFQLCRNRILMGRFRYGPNVGMSHFDCTKEIQRCLSLYLLTRNTEQLIDLMNYAYLEFRFGTHPDRHFTSSDDEEHSDGGHKW